MVEIDFENEHALDTQPSTAIQGGKLVLDPARHWCVRQATIKIASDSIVAESTYDVSLANLPPPSCVPTRLVMRQNGVRKSDANAAIKQPWHATTTIDYELTGPDDLPPNTEFTLSAFGLPEPIGVPLLSRPRWHIYLAVGGIALLLVAGWRWRQGRRT